MSYTLNWSEATFLITKVKNTVPRTLLFIILMAKNLLQILLLLRKRIEKDKSRRIQDKQVIKKKGEKPYDHFGGNFNVELYLSNYATKADLKGVTGVDTSNIAAKSDLASLKAKIQGAPQKCPYFSLAIT